MLIGDIGIVLLSTQGFRTIGGGSTTILVLLALNPPALFTPLQNWSGIFSPRFAHLLFRLPSLALLWSGNLQHFIPSRPRANMGAETSHEVIDDDVAPLVLSARTVKAVVEYIKSGECQKVVFMVCSRMSC